ncbi:MAG: hypothetical protein HYR64_00155 [Fimbriimonas ginsengisoli]|uniref:Uncharacterized protein n=1 Tax=Fimbriimonas ginsengisoli TaxID=1005039 RepID=A0A931PSJ1_FIMGI|nr:hypothetical protein [Fimbriimonas ginsengisoli]
MTLEECSRRAWENGGFGVGDLSYYNKGLVAGLVLDAAIRSRTRGAKSLDDVMRALYRRYRMPNRGYAEDGLLASIAEVGGADMAPLYRILTQTTYDVPYGMLSGIGLGLDAGGEVVAPNGGADPRLKALYRGWLGRVERVVEQGQPEPDRGRH